MPPIIWTYLPGVAGLLAASAFFSGSEAAFFSLTPAQRRALAQGNRAERLGARLLDQSERLLMGILFWNLAINIGYFSIVSKVALTLEETASESSHSAAALVTFGSLLTIIVLGEFLPKSIAVLYPRTFIRFVGLPLALSIRILDAFLPIIKVVNEASRRLLWPGLKPEPYLELSDLDRAVELSTVDASLFEHESQVLRNIIQISEIRVEEWMRPRTQFRTFVPPINIDQLHGEKTPSGYMLITDEDGNELLAAVDLGNLLPQHANDLEKAKKPLVVVPWCTTVADALDRLRGSGCRVAAVVNEHGETIGVLTWEDIFDAILQQDRANSHRELAKADLRQESEYTWVATGMTRLRNLERVFGQRINDGNNLTVSGLIQEQLHRLPELGDQCCVGHFRFEVIDTGQRGEILARIEFVPEIDPKDGDQT